MTALDILDSWRQAFPDVPPVGYLVRASYPGRWLRIHSLPESKRYPGSEPEMNEVLRRHNAVAADVLGREGCALITGAYSGAAAGAWSVSLQDTEEEPYGLNLSVQSTTWEAGAHDGLLRSVAEATSGPVLFYSVRTGQAYAPYDGGADLFFRDGASRDAGSGPFASWRSPLESGS